MSTALYLDNSTLAAVARCSTEAFVRYVHGQTSPEERATLRAGTAGHEALAVYFRTGDAERALDTFANGPLCAECAGSTDMVECKVCKGTGRAHQGYEAWAEENVSPLDRLAYSNTSRILASWFDQHPLAGLPFKVDPELVEIGFAYPLTDEGVCMCGHPDAIHDDRARVLMKEGPGRCLADCDCLEFCVLVFCGRMDALARGLEIPELHVIEHKTTGNISPHWLKKFRMDSQSTGYLWAAQQHTGLPISHSFLNAIEFGKLPSDPSKRCKTHAVTYAECGHLHATFELATITRTPTQVAEWKKSALHLARRFRTLMLLYPELKDVHRVRMQGTFNGSCPTCALHDFCLSDRPLHLVSSLLVYDPWSPLDYSAGAARETGRKP